MQLMWELEGKANDGLIDPRKEEFYKIRRICKHMEGTTKIIEIRIDERWDGIFSVIFEGLRNALSSVIDFVDNFVYKYSPILLGRSDSPGFIGRFGNFIGGLLSGRSSDNKKLPPPDKKLPSPDKRVRS